MNKTFRNLALSLAGFTMSLVLLPQTVFAGETTADDYVIEKDDETQTCKITGYTGSSIKPDIPDSISGYTVTSIGGSAFTGEDVKVNITSVSIPKYVQSLDDKAFEGCDELVTVKFTGSRTKSIGAFAFNKCKALKDISIPSSVTSIGEGAFMQCASLESINIPSSIVDIPLNAFAYDSSLSSVSLNNVKTIGESAFNMCAIEKIRFPNTLESIGKNAFFNNNSMEVTCLGAVKSIDDTAFDVDEDHDKPTITVIADGNNPGDIKRFAQASDAYVYIRYYYKITRDIESGYGSIYVTGTQIYNDNSFLAGDTITVRVNPTKKYRLVKWAAESTATVKFSDESLLTATFRMPAANVMLTPEFVELFTVTFYDEDGATVLYSDLFAKGENVVYSGATPTKSSTKEYIYKFDHWSPELGVVTADTSYKAVYKAIPVNVQADPTNTPVPTPEVTAEPTQTPAATNTPAVTTAPEAATPTTAPAAQENTGFVIKGKTAVFTKPAVVNANKVSIPATVKIKGKTYKVTEIKDNAFKGNKSLTQVTIGKNITKIGKNAFNGCKNLKKVTFKSTSVTKIGKCAFKGINKKAKFTLPKKKAKVYKKMIQKAGFKI